MRPGGVRLAGWLGWAGETRALLAWAGPAGRCALAAARCTPASPSPCVWTTPLWTALPCLPHLPSRSRSPAIHNAALRQAGLNGVYVPLLVDDMPSFLATFTGVCGGHTPRLPACPPRPAALFALLGLFAMAGKAGRRAGEAGG